MTGDVDDVVGAAHDEKVAVHVTISGICGFVVTREVREIARSEAGVGIPQSRQAARRQRQLDCDIAELTLGDGMTPIVEDAHLIAWHWQRRRAALDREPAKPDRIAGDGPACLRLPPVVYHRYFE